VKRRIKDPVVVNNLTLIDVDQLRQVWRASTWRKKDLGQCTGLCRSQDDAFHHPNCEYIADVEHQEAVNAATHFLQSNPGGSFPGTITAAQVGPGLAPNSPTAELALSFLTDAIELRGLNDFKNGRHRATALFDVGVTGLVPVKYV
jgi:hypothetical protein